MKELTPAQRICALTATAEAFSKIFAFAHKHGWDTKFYFDYSYLFHGYEDKIWFTMWGVVDGDETAVHLNGPSLYAHNNDSEDEYLAQFAITPENIRKAADTCIARMQDFIDHYDKYAEGYRAQKAAKEGEQ